MGKPVGFPISSCSSFCRMLLDNSSRLFGYEIHLCLFLSDSSGFLLARWDGGYLDEAMC